MYYISFYAPVDHADKVKQAMFQAGAGRIGEYQHCAWQTLGQGQFMPLEGSNAFIGEKNNLETLQELKVEMVVSDEHIRTVIQALKSAHPYETPAYQVMKLENF